MHETLLIASSWTLTKWGHYVLQLSCDIKRKKQLIIVFIFIFRDAMQVIDQPESFNLLNTLLFNIPGSHGAAYSGSCAQVSSEIPTFLQRRSFYKNKVQKSICKLNVRRQNDLCVHLSLLSELPKIIIVIQYFWQYSQPPLIQYYGQMSWDPRNISFPDQS